MLTTTLLLLLSVANKNNCNENYVTPAWNLQSPGDCQVISDCRWYLTATST